MGYKIEPDTLSIGVYVGKETTDNNAKVYLEISMSFLGIAPIGRLIALVFASLILTAIMVYFLAS